MEENITLKIDTKVETKGAEDGIGRLLEVVKKMMTTASLIIADSAQKVKLFGKIGEAAQKAAAGQAQLAKATAAAGKAAKNSLADFDRLNVLELKNAAGGGGSASKPDKPPKPDLPADEIDIPGLEALRAVLESIWGVLERLKPGAEWFWQNFLVPLGEWAYGMVTTGLYGIADAFSAISLWIDDNKVKLEVLWATMEPLVLGIRDFIFGVLENVKLFFEEWCAAFTESLTGVMDLWMGIITGDWDQAWGGIQQIFGANKDLLLTGLGLLWDSMKTGFLTALDTVKALWAPVGQWFMDKVLAPLRKNFGWLWDGIVTAGQIAFQMVVGVWEKLTGWLTETIIKPVSGQVKGLWDDIVSFYQTGIGAVTQNIKGYINFCLDLVEAAANLFIDLFNGIIDALNTIQVSIPKWVPKYGGNTFGIDIPNIPSVSLPRLATGAVIPPNAEFAAILGDQKQGYNLEAPEGLLREIVREESGAREIVIRFEGSMAQLARMLLPALDQEQSRQGARLIMGGV